MATVATKKHFTNVAALRRFTPAVLAEFLWRFPAYLAKRELAVPTSGVAALDNMPYRDIQDACMASDIDPELNHVLFMATKLGDASGWEAIQEEMEDRGAKAGFDPRLHTAYDLPLMTWLRRKIPEHEDILEQSYARGRMHGKSAYRYYAPTQDYRDKFNRPTSAVLRQLRQDLAQHFLGDPNGKGIKVFDYLYKEEMWFLVRYPGQTVRPDAVDKDGEDQDVSYTPGEYDAVVYHLEYGDLRLNTVRKRDHACYRIAMGMAMVGESNVFNQKKHIITLAPLKLECLHFFPMKDEGDFPRVQPIEVSFTDSHVPGRRVIWRVLRQDGHLLYYPTGPNKNRLLPDTVDTVQYAKFRYRLNDRDPWQSMTVHQGMDLRFERDGDSALLEGWLRERKFILDVLGPRKESKGG